MEYGDRHERPARCASVSPATLIVLAGWLVRLKMSAGVLSWSFLRSTATSQSQIGGSCWPTSRRRPATSTGTCCSQRWQSTWRPGMAAALRPGRRSGGCASSGFPTRPARLAWTPWSMRPLRSGGGACSSRRTIWKEREPAGIAAAGPGADRGGARASVDDIRFLIGKLQLSSAREVLAICAEVFPGEQVPARAQLLLEDLFTPGDHGSQLGEPQ
jgi:hypothetical protein